MKNFSKLTNLFVLLKIVKQLDINFFVNFFVEKDNYDVCLLWILIIDNNKNKNNFVTYKLNCDRKNFNII